MSWLWKSDANSPASYEKALSKLSTQITAANVSVESTRSRGRRLKALWTLYTTLTFLLSLLILVLVIGPQNWSVAHYGGLIAGPTVIYLVRLLLSTAFDWRAGRQQAHLESLQSQRETKIADLKKATKYDSTQELLQKYGGAPSPAQKETSSKQSSPNNKSKPRQPQDQMQRTGLPPPPTANIQGRQPVQPPTTPPQMQRPKDATFSNESRVQSSFMPEEPGFAPNAFSSQQPTRTQYEQTSHWYDRILDVMLGEDESQAKNRMVLLCQNCRLVNGQAPPGVKSLEELGKWRCASCGAWNGIESEDAKVVREMAEKTRTENGQDWQAVSQGDESQAADLHPADIEEDTGKTSGSVQGDSDVTKRVTRSSGQVTVDGL